MLELAFLLHPFPHTRAPAPKLGFLIAPLFLALERYPSMGSLGCTLVCPPRAPFPHWVCLGCRSTNVQAALNTAIMLVDVSYPKWRILFCNVQVDKATGLSGSEISGQHVWDHFTVVGKTEVGSLPTLP